MADLFGQNFQFYTSNRQQSKKTTPIGIFFTVLIILVTSMYFVWLIDRLANNKFLPKVNIQAHLFGKEDSSYTFQNLPPFVLRFEFDGGLPEDFIFEDYFDFEITHGNKGDSDNHTKILPWKECISVFPELNDTLQFQQYEYCIDQKSIYLDFENPQYNIKVLFKACTEKPNCKTLEEIYQMTKDFPVDIKPQQILQEISYSTKGLLTTRQKYYVKADRNIVHSVTADAQKSKLTIDDGLVLSNSKQDNYIYQVDMVQQSYERLLMQHEENFKNTFMIYDYYLIDKGKLLVVEYPKIPEMLAQANGVFITLIAFTGIIVKLISQVKIQESVIDIHINYYYTGFKKVLFKQDPLKFNESQSLKVSIFSSILVYIKQFLRLKKVKKQRKSSNSKVLDEKQHKEDIYSQVHGVAVKNMELRQIYREILELKTQVQLLYDDQAYSAVRYCQRSFIDGNKISDSKENSYEKINHLEKLDLIDRYENINQKVFKKFLEEQNQINNNQNLQLLQQNKKVPLQEKRRKTPSILKSIDLSKRETAQMLSTGSYQINQPLSTRSNQSQQFFFDNNIELKRSNYNDVRSRIYECLDQEIVDKYKIQKIQDIQQIIQVQDQEPELDIYTDEYQVDEKQTVTDRLQQYKATEEIDEHNIVQIL